MSLVRIVNDARRYREVFFCRISLWWSLTSTGSGGANEWLAFIDRTRLDSMEGTFVSGVWKLTARLLSISVAVAQWNSIAIYIGTLTRRLAIYRLYAQSTEGARGSSIDSQGRRDPACASARPTRFYDDHVRHRVGLRSRREFLTLKLLFR